MRAMLGRVRQDQSMIDLELPQPRIRRIEVHAGDRSNPKDRGAHESPIIATDQRDEIREALAALLPAVAPIDDIALMEYSVLSFVFRDETGEELGSIGYKRSGWLSRPGLAGDRPLADPDLILAWLSGHGWRY